MSKPIPKIFVKPVTGGRVKDPVTFELLKPEGDWKPDNSYWRRRVLFGDCVLAADEQAPAIAESRKSKKGEDR